MAVLGPGTGLGVACLLPGTGKRLVISSEGGHATLAGANDREDEIIKHLRSRFGQRNQRNACFLVMAWRTSIVGGSVRARRNCS